ncbi:MAG: cysteine synthase A [Candidatus Omnitrophica bacterium CG11_big_fil_rev_8_21_14_0_20_42_13]|uniref:cysteine synthase n=1 Tax=Candidatus Ghiorseimicrobium undicola TaxID=1974746 RepID=A0A2H0LV40_9BACT|nr:MAG: cysteine synthase A [Candidatus Omnitrophica bacterium CG11_big_fil_rev_8_21_14_0_20_42_13]
MPISDIIANDVTELISRTPLVRLNNLPHKHSAEILAKLEMFNPGGSVKDRACLSMINDAEEKGLLKKGYTIIEPTSGNTGIGLCMIAAVRGYKCIIVMPEAMSLERIYILKCYGAEVVLTPGHKGMEGAIQKAEELHKKTPYSFIPHQFNNEANAQIHRTTTAEEILRLTGGKLDAFVAGVGTGGTITGVGDALKKYNQNIQIIAVEPKGSAVLSGHKPGAHKIQGIGAGFIPKILNLQTIDRIFTVSDDEAFLAAKNLAKQEGLLVGISSGAAAQAAFKIAEELGEGKRVVVVFPDTGERYFSLQQYFEA